MSYKLSYNIKFNIIEDRTLQEIYDSLIENDIVLAISYSYYDEGIRYVNTYPPIGPIPKFTFCLTCGKEENEYHSQNCQNPFDSVILTDEGKKHYNIGTEDEMIFYEDVVRNYGIKKAKNYGDYVPFFTNVVSVKLKEGPALKIHPDNSTMVGLKSNTNYKKIFKDLNLNVNNVIVTTKSVVYYFGDKENEITDFESIIENLKKLVISKLSYKKNDRLNFKLKYKNFNKLISVQIRAGTSVKLVISDNNIIIDEVQDLLSNYLVSKRIDKSELFENKIMNTIYNKISDKVKYPPQPTSCRGNYQKPYPYSFSGNPQLNSQYVMSEGKLSKGNLINQGIELFNDEVYEPCSGNITGTDKNKNIQLNFERLNNYNFDINKSLNINSLSKKEIKAIEKKLTGVKKKLFKQAINGLHNVNGKPATYIPGTQDKRFGGDGSKILENRKFNGLLQLDKDQLLKVVKSKINSIVYYNPNKVEFPISSTVETKEDLNILDPNIEHKLHGLDGRIYYYRPNMLEEIIKTTVFKFNVRKLNQIEVELFIQLPNKMKKITLLGKSYFFDKTTVSKLNDEDYFVINYAKTDKIQIVKENPFLLFEKDFNKNYLDNPFISVAKLFYLKDTI